MVQKKGRHLKAILLLTFPALLTGGCASYHPKPITPEVTLSAFESRSLNNAGLKIFLEVNLHREISPWPPELWDFSLLSLAALYYHPELEVAKSKWGVARAEIITAGEHPNPTVTFTPQYDFTPLDVVSPWTIGFSFDIPIETAGKRGHRVKQAEYMSEAARLNLANTAWEIRSRLRTSLLDMHALLETEAILREQVSVRESINNLLEQRVGAGEISRIELAQSSIALDQIRLRLADAQRRTAGLRIRVAEVLGLPVRALEGIEISFKVFDNRLSITDSLVANFRRRALFNRPDILALLAEYEAGQAALQLQIARQYPDIQLGPGYQWDQGENKWFVGIGATLPVFNRNEGRIAEAEAKREETGARFKALQAQVIGEIERALAEYRMALQELEAAESMLLAHRRTLKSSEILFNSGETDRLDLFLARLEYLTAKTSMVESQSKVQQALGMVEDAMRRPLNFDRLAVEVPQPAEDREKNETD